MAHEDPRVEEIARMIYENMIRGKPHMPNVHYEDIIKDDGWREHLYDAASRIVKIEKDVESDQGV